MHPILWFSFFLVVLCNVFPPIYILHTLLGTAGVLSIVSICWTFTILLYATLYLATSNNGNQDSDQETNQEDQDIDREVEFITEDETVDNQEEENDDEEHVENEDDHDDRDNQDDDEDVDNRESNQEEAENGTEDEELIKEKKGLIFDLEKLRKKGWLYIPEFTLESNIEEMRFEYYRITKRKEHFNQEQFDSDDDSYNSDPDLIERDDEGTRSDTQVDEIEVDEIEVDNTPEDKVNDTENNCIRETIGQLGGVVDQQCTTRKNCDLCGNWCHGQTAKNIGSKL